MKTFTTLSFALLFSSLSIFAHNGDPVPVKSTLLFETSDIALFAIDSNDEGLISNAIYNANNAFFTLETMKSIQFVQILNQDGELEYQIPVESKFLNISMSDLLEGSYSVNLRFEGQEDYFATRLVKKK